MCSYLATQVFRAILMVLQDFEKTGLRPNIEQGSDISKRSDPLALKEVRLKFAKIPTIEIV